jgi:hypothetical protein
MSILFSFIHECPISHRICKHQFLTEKEISPGRVSRMGATGYLTKLAHILRLFIGDENSYR